MSKSQSITHHPSNDGTQFSTVQDEIENLRSANALTALSADAVLGVDHVLIRADGTGRKTEATGIAVDDSNNVTGVAELDATFVNATTVNGTNLFRNGNVVAIVTQTVIASFTFKFPENEDVFLILNCPFAWDITQTNTITEVGTATVTVINNGALLTANAGSPALVTQGQSSSVPLNGYIAVRFASCSSDCENLCLTIVGTRTLA